MHEGKSNEAVGSMPDSGIHKRIEQALAGQEFVLHYQPQVDLQSGRVLGAEALIRWQDPQRGLLAPRYFLPFVAGTPLASALGSWVLETAIGQLDHWLRSGLAVSVSVNLAIEQVHDQSFPVPSFQPCFHVLDMSVCEKRTGPAGWRSECHKDS